MRKDNGEDNEWKIVLLILAIGALFIVILTFTQGIHDYNAKHLITAQDCKCNGCECEVKEK